jgi:hypothetical protein
LQRQINAVGTSVAACTAFFAGVWHMDMPTAIFSDDFPVHDSQKKPQANKFAGGFMACEYFIFRLETEINEV